MPRKSDIPYIASANDGFTRVQPVLDASVYEFEDLSGTTADAQPFQLFADARGANGVSETVARILANLSETESLWINFAGGIAGVREPGSFEVMPGEKCYIPTRQAVSVIGAAGIPYTAYEG